MSIGYHIGFDGAASATVNLMLRAVERQLNWQAVRAQGPGDASAVTAASSVKDPNCPSGVNCSGTVGGHGPSFAEGVVLGLVLGVLLRGLFQSFKSSKSS